MKGKSFRIIISAMVTLCIITTSITVFSYVDTSFSDVSKSHWAYDSIMNMVRLGVIEGYPDDTYKPDKIVSREEFSKILCGATSIPLANPNSNTFADVKKGDWPFKYVETVKDYLTGYPSASGSKPLFKGKQDATREDVAVALVKIKGFDKTVNPNPNILDDMYKDVDSVSSRLKDLMAIAVEKKLITGYPDHTIRGTQTLTRAEAAVLIDRANRIAGDIKDVSYIGTSDLNSIKIECSKTSGKVGEKIQAIAKGQYSNNQTTTITTQVAWTSTNSSILSVNEDGLVSLNKIGTAKIRANLDGITKDLEIKVVAQDEIIDSNISKINVNPETKDIKVNESLNMKAEVVYKNGSTVNITNDASWESSNSDIAIINSQGKVVGLKEGIALIKASYKGFNDYSGLSVTESVYSQPSSSNPATIQ